MKKHPLKARLLIAIGLRDCTIAAGKFGRSMLVNCNIYTAWSSSQLISPLNALMQDQVTKED